VACFFRGSAEPYPGGFVFRQLVLAQGGLTLLALWFTPDRKVIRIGEEVLSAWCFRRHRGQRWFWLPSCCGRVRLPITQRISLAERLICSLL